MELWRPRQGKQDGACSWGLAPRLPATLSKCSYMCQKATLSAPYVLRLDLSEPLGASLPDGVAATTSSGYTPVQLHRVSNNKRIEFPSVGRKELGDALLGRESRSDTRVQRV